MWLFIKIIQIFCEVRTQLVGETQVSPTVSLSIFSVNCLDNAEDLAAGAVDERVRRVLRAQPYAVRRQAECFAGRLVLEQRDHDVTVARFGVLTDDDEVVVHDADADHRVAADAQRVVFAEGIHPNMLKAAVEAKAEGICHPILLGNEERIEKLAKELDLSLEGIEIVNLRHDRESERRERYARILCEKRAREGANFQEANDKMFERNYFGMMMVETGEADAFVTGLYTKYSNTIKVAKEVIGIQPEYKHFGTMHILNSKKGTYFIADTLINRHPDTDTLIDIAKLSAKAVRFFNQEPVMAMLSYSNFGSDAEGSPAKVHEAINQLHREYPDLAIDGEMQVKFALNDTLRDEKYPFTRLKGKEVNTLVFPNLSSANATYQLIQSMSETEVIGPIQMGLNKPIHFTDIESSVRDIVNITAIACIDAIVDKKKKAQ